jgi:hypothetical protein
MADSRLAVNISDIALRLPRGGQARPRRPHGIDPLLEQALRPPPEHKDPGRDHGFSIMPVGVR